MLDFRPKLLDHAVLVQNDLNQLLAAKKFQVVQDPGCTIFALRARTFKSGYAKSPLINYPGCPWSIKGDEDGQAFYGILNGVLVDSSGTPVDKDEIAQIALAIIEIIKEHHIVDVWRNDVAQNNMRNAVDGNSSGPCISRDTEIFRNLRLGPGYLLKNLAMYMFEGNASPVTA